MIYQTKYFIDNPKATIILVHGIAEHSGRYEYLANILNENGYDVITYDQLGHGKSMGPRGKIQSFHNHIDVLNEIVLEEKQKNSKKLFLLGHSMGGLVVNLYQVKYGDVDGIVSVAAATDVPSNMKVFKFIGFKWLSFLRVKPTIFKKHLAKDPNVYLKTSTDPLMLKYMYVSLLGEMFIKGTKYLHGNLNNYNTPVLFVHGTADKIVNSKCSEDMFKLIPSSDKELKMYEGEYHELLNDYNKESIIRDIIDWLDERN